MRIASWNVNSLRVRLEQVTSWLKTNEPDLLLLQELKGTEFPADVFQELGYKSAAVTQKGYNGVAILSRSPLQVTSTALLGEETDRQSRFLEARIEGMRLVSIYVPNGNPVGTDKFTYKLAWMDRLIWQMKIWRQSEMFTLVGGDFNVIPEDLDCYAPAAWVHDALFQPETRARYRALLELGYTDAFRSLHPGEGGHFTYWDYFRRAFEHNRGIRIDHFLLSPALAERLEACEIDKQIRAQEKPSDHAPIVLQVRSRGLE
jgi:exodeoxyribonuclease-3